MSVLVQNLYPRIYVAFQPVSVVCGWQAITSQRVTTVVTIVLIVVRWGILLRLRHLGFNNLLVFQ